MRPLSGASGAPQGQGHTLTSPQEIRNTDVILRSYNLIPSQSSSIFILTTSCPSLWPSILPPRSVARPRISEYYPNAVPPHSSRTRTENKTHFSECGGLSNYVGGPLKCLTASDMFHSIRLAIALKCFEKVTHHSCSLTPDSSLATRLSGALPSQKTACPAAN